MKCSHCGSEKYVKNASSKGFFNSLLARWVRELAGNLRREVVKVAEELPSDSLPDIIEMDEIYTRIKKGLQEQVWTAFSRRRGKIVAS
jgi:hypothetical protein